jgi:hypothetical protein
VFSVGSVSHAVPCLDDSITRSTSPTALHSSLLVMVQLTVDCIQHWILTAVASRTITDIGSRTLVQRSHSAHLVPVLCAATLVGETFTYGTGGLVGCVKFTVFSLYLRCDDAQPD